MLTECHVAATTYGSVWSNCSGPRCRVDTEEYEYILFDTYEVSEDWVSLWT